MKWSVGILSLFLTLGAMAEEATEFSFQLIDGWAIVLDGSLGGLQHQKMLIDTGAVPSAINIRVAKRLGLLGSVEELSLMNRSIPVRRVRVPDVHLGIVSAEALDMVAMDLGRVEKELGIRLDAVVGLDLLGKRNFSVDYHRKKLAFGNNNRMAGAIAFEVKYEAGGSYIVIPLESGGEKLQLLVDTGTKDLMLFRPRLKGSLRQLRVRGQKPNVNAGGNDTLAEVEMRSIKLGPIAIPVQKAYVWDTSERDLRDFDGVIGPLALGVSLVTFNFDWDEVSFTSR